MWTLHWDEGGQRCIHQDVLFWGVQWKNKSQCSSWWCCFGNEFLQMSWTSHRPRRWQSALIYLMESQGTNGRWGSLETSSWLFLRPQARRLQVTGLIQVMLKTPTLGTIPDISFPVTVVYTWICSTKLSFSVSLTHLHPELIEAQVREEI